MTMKSKTRAAALALAMLVAPHLAMAGGHALTKDERAMLRDAGAAERAIAQRMDNARDSLSQAQQSVVSDGDATKAEKSLRRANQNLEKAQRALESLNYRAAYEYAGRAEILAKRAAEVRQ